MDGVIDRVRQPEYTGENRCIPCTVVNVAIAAVVGIAVATVTTVELTAVLVALCLAVIALRGYLVPGTPALTRRYFPDRLLAAFGKAPEAGADSGWEPAADEGSDDADWATVEKVRHHRDEAVDVVDLLVEVGAVEPVDNEYRFTDAFAGAVDEWLATLQEGATGGEHAVGLDRETLAGLFGATPGEISYKDRAYPAIKVGVRVRKWPGPASLLADVAAHRALDARTPRWSGVPFEQRLDALEALRSFHDTCPSCGGPLQETTETVQSCCLSADVIALACQHCGEQLVERDPASASWRKLVDFRG